jgi:KH domain
VEKAFAPLSVLPYIIGKKGSVLKNIQEFSGANVQIPKREDNETPAEEDEMVEIEIEGVEAAIAKAKQEIAKIVDEKVPFLCQWS